MRKTILISLLTVISLVINNYSLNAWGKLGHATIGHIAQEHLTPKARKALSNYLDGKSLAAIASDADTYRGMWTMDLGFIPTNIDNARPAWMRGFDFSTPHNIAPYSHMITVDRIHR